MDTRALASVEDATSWPEQQSPNGFPSMVNGLTNRPGSGAIGGGFAKNVRHDVCTDWPVSSGTWSAVLRFKILDVPVSNVFRSRLLRRLTPASRSASTGRGSRRPSTACSRVVSTTLLHRRSESCCACLVDAAPVLGDRHSIVALGGRCAHHTIAHVAQHARRIARARVPEATAAWRQGAIDAGPLALHAVFRRVDLAAIGQGEGDLATHAGAAARGAEALGGADVFARFRHIGPGAAAKVGETVSDL
jgi:hypothetical protein